MAEKALQRAAEELLREISKLIDWKAYDKPEGKNGPKSAVSFIVELRTLQDFREAVIAGMKHKELAIVHTTGVTIPQFIEALSDVTKRTIWALYPDKEFLQREFLKMVAWLDVNSHKAPKSKAGWARFVNGWLQRGWEQYRRGLQGNPMVAMDWREIFK